MWAMHRGVEVSEIVVTLTTLVGGTILTSHRVGTKTKTKTKCKGLTNTDFNGLCNNTKIQTQAQI